METVETVEPGKLVVLAYNIEEGIAYIIAHHIKNNFIMHYLEKSASITWRPDPASRTGIWWYSMMDMAPALIVSGCVLSEDAIIDYDNPQNVVFAVDIEEKAEQPISDESSIQRGLLYFIVWGQCPTDWLNSFVREVVSEYGEILEKLQTELPEKLVYLQNLFQKTDGASEIPNKVKLSTDKEISFEAFSVINRLTDGPIPLAYRSRITKLSQPVIDVALIPINEQAQTSRRKGRYRLLPEEINRRKKIVKQAEQQKRKNPQLLWKEIAANLGLPVRTLYEYLRQYGTLHRQGLDK